MQVANQTVVSIHYTLTDSSGDKLDSSDGREPLAYLHGAGNIISGLESALDGKQVGDKLNVTIEPGDAYGEHNESLVQEVPMEAFQGIDKVEAGMQFQTNTPNGPQIVTVTQVVEESVTVDANHPLAGQQLNFDVEVVDVRAATDEEKEHGHVHGADGHDHDHD